MITEIETLLSETPTSFNDLATIYKTFLASFLRPTGLFTAEQSQFLSAYSLLVTPEQLSEIETLNAESPIHKLSTIVIEDSHYLSPSLLTDCRDGESYAFAREFLFGLVIVSTPSIEQPSQLI